MTGTLLAILAVVTAAPPADEARFDQMASAHRAASRDLSVTRGMPPRDRDVLLLSAIRAVLKGAFGSGTALLVYAYRAKDEVLDAWVVGPDGIRASASTMVSREDLDGAIASLQGAVVVSPLVASRSPRLRALKRQESPPEQPPPTDRALARLGTLLLPRSIGAALRPVTELLVVPTLGIGAVPFAALEVDGHPLIEGRTVTILPDLFGLGALTASSRPGPLEPALVVGDPALAGDPEWDFPPLPGARAEAIFVAKATGETALVGERATLGAVRARADDVALLYLATHGVAVPQDPLEGFLALSKAGGVDRWTARAIQGRRMAARLAVLSACQTGLGFGHDGGVIGLGRAFLLAGVPHVVMSLWNVDDAATATLMKTFLENAKTAVPAEALRRAMLTTRTRYPDPLKWAAFSLLATPPGGFDPPSGADRSRLVLVDEDGKALEQRARIPAGRKVWPRVIGGDGRVRKYRYIIEVDVKGNTSVGDASDPLVFGPPLGRELIVLVEADRPVNRDVPEHGMTFSPEDAPSTLADIAAMFPLDKPDLRLRILRIEVESVQEAQR
jgi:hypothetical protein